MCVCVCVCVCVYIYIYSIIKFGLKLVKLIMNTHIFKRVLNAMRVSRAVLNYDYYVYEYMIQVTLLVIKLG